MAEVNVNSSKNVKLIIWTATAVISQMNPIIILTALNRLYPRRGHSCVLNKHPPPNGCILLRIKMNPVSLVFPNFLLECKIAEITDGHVVTYVVNWLGVFEERKTVLLHKTTLITSSEHLLCQLIVCRVSASNQRRKNQRQRGQCQTEASRPCKSLVHLTPTSSAHL